LVGTDDYIHNLYLSGSVWKHGILNTTWNNSEKVGGKILAIDNNTLFFVGLDNTLKKYKWNGISWQFSTISPLVSLWPNNLAFDAGNSLYFSRKCSPNPCYSPGNQKINESCIFEPISCSNRFNQPREADENQIEEKSALVASPNPSTDILALNTDELGVIPIHVDIYVSNGQLVKSFSILGINNTIDIADLNSGLHFMVLTLIDGSRKTIKFVKI
jgi:Secretion system C-terminal sorting domain